MGTSHRPIEISNVSKFIKAYIHVLCSLNDIIQPHLVFLLGVCIAINHACNISPVIEPITTSSGPCQLWDQFSCP